MKFFLLLLSLSFTLSLKAQHPEKSTIIGSPTEYEWGANIVADNNGNTYLGGNMGDKVLIVKQDPLQQTIWSKTITFDPAPSLSIRIGFLDLLGDTLFGGGDVEDANGAGSLGTFYFKMNAQTGTTYWSKYDLSSAGYISSMRYANGKYFLVGGSLMTGMIYGNVQAVSSQTGDIIWQTPLLQLTYPIAGTNNETLFTSATEMRNGKMFITGTQRNDPSITYPDMPLLVGIDESGNVFLERRIPLPFIPGGLFTSFQGSRIEYDMNDNILLTSFNNGPMSVQNDPNLVLTKLDLLGNVLFSKEYEIDGDGGMQVHGLNETSDSYVLCGTIHSNFTGLYALKLSKNGVVQKCIGIQKPNIYYGGAASNNAYGNSDFKNNKHYFATFEMLVPGGDSNLSEIILDEDLNTIEDCSELSQLPVIVTNLTPQLEPLQLTPTSVGIDYHDNIILEDLDLYIPCDSLSLDLVQISNCQSSFIANVSGFHSPTFYWSDGSISSSNTFSTPSLDTLIVRVLDIRCCELTDTIIPVLQASNMVMSLGNDTTICIQQGASFTLTPTVTNPLGAVSYLWNNNSTAPSLSVTNSGLYWLEVSDDCRTIRDSIQITLHLFPEITGISDTAICEGLFPLYVNAGLTPGASVVWDNGLTTTDRIITAPGTYTLQATNQCGTTSDSMTVTKMADIDLYFPNDSIQVCAFQISVNLLQIETNYAYELFESWTHQLVGANLTKSGWYDIRAFNYCDERWDSIYVDLGNDQAIFIPNSFTPNGDGINDNLEFAETNVTVSSLRIFNRWGEEIFQLTQNNGQPESINKSWNGHYDGKPCPEGIYSVQIVYTNCFGTPTQFNGHVNLLR